MGVKDCTNETTSSPYKKCSVCTLGPVALFEEFGNHIPSQKLQGTQNL